MKIEVKRVLANISKKTSLVCMRRGLVLSHYIVLAYGEPHFNETSMGYATAIRDMTRTRFQVVFGRVRGVWRILSFKFFRTTPTAFRAGLYFSPSHYTLGRHPLGHLTRLAFSWVPENPRPLLVDPQGSVSRSSPQHWSAAASVEQLK